MDSNVKYVKDLYNGSELNFVCHAHSVKRSCGKKFNSSVSSVAFQDIVSRRTLLLSFLNVIFLSIHLHYIGVAASNLTDGYFKT